MIRRAVPLAAGLAAAALVFSAVVIATDGDGRAAGDRGALAGADGRAVFARMGCGSCHHLTAASAAGRIGPDLDVDLEDHTRESLIAKIVAPGPATMMPGDFGARMSAAELDALVEFLLAARGRQGARPVEPASSPAVANRFDAVVFDNDGLLLDTEVAWTRAETMLFERHGSAFTMDHKRALIGSSRSQSALKLEAMLGLPEEGERLMDELHELVMAEALAGVPPRPGALELLQAVRSAGMPVGLASNSSREFVERVLSVAGLLNGHFDVIVTADDVDRPKPAPDLYLAACAALGATPARAAALEDSPPGVAAAVAAGMQVVAVPYFPDMPIKGASLSAGSLDDPRVAEALGLVPGARARHP